MIVKLTKKGIEIKALVKEIPGELVKILRNENVQLEEIIKMKDTLNDWIEILSENNKVQIK